MTRIFTQKEINTIFEKWEQPNDWSYQQIADAFGFDRKSIARLIGKAFPDQGTSGEYNSNHILTSDDVRKMREMYHTSDMSYQDIATEFGVAKSTALRAIKGQCWKGIE